MDKGARGLTLMGLEAGDALAGAAAYVRSVRVSGLGRGGKPREEQLEIRSLNNALAARAQGPGREFRLQAGRHRAGAVMGGLDISQLGLALLVVFTLASALLGRRLRERREGR